jgi:hypothetical protein
VSDQAIQRKLAADMAGYTALMEANEEADFEHFAEGLRLAGLPES